MKVIVKFIDPAGQEFYYPKPESVSGFPTPWRISALTPNALMLAQVLEDANESIQFLDYFARINNFRMELVPAQSILGTYLSTYEKSSISTYTKKHLVEIYLIGFPLLILLEIIILLS